MKCFHYFKDKFRSKGQRSFKPSCSAASPPGISELDEAKAHNLRVFSFSELRKATRNFNPGLKIDEDDFGSVYRGKIKPDGGKGEPLVVAIKKFNKGGSGFQGSKEWSAKVQSLRDFEHPNVIKLIGLCAVGGESGIEPHRLLVYEFMQNKSLEDHLFSHAFPPLPWKIRLQIILGAAQGLAYLHEGLQVEVIHGCVKPSNVLLDDKLNPKLSFGLVQNPTMDGHGDDLPQYARVIWINSAAPEYIATGHLTYKTDVWCFGVLLYEILSGRRSIDHNRPKSEQILVQWVKQFPTNGERFGCIMDPRLGNRYSIGAAREIAKLADTCLSTIRKERPKMSGVVKRLERIIQASKEPPTPRHLK